MALREGKRFASGRRDGTRADPPVADEEPFQSQTEVALDLIRSRIVDMTLEPGSRIDERLLVDRFRLGRTPAREAMNRLVAEGFVRAVPNRGGTFVRKLDLVEMGEVVVAQQLAEAVLAQMCRMDDATLLADLTSLQRRYAESVERRDYLAITQLNQDFHLRMYRTIGNALFYDFAKSTHLHLRRLNVYVYIAEAAADPACQTAEFVGNLDEHDGIIESVRRRDREALMRLLPEHAKGTQRRLVRLLEEKRVPAPTPDLSGLKSPFA